MKLLADLICIVPTAQCHFYKPTSQLTMEEGARSGTNRLKPPSMWEKRPDPRADVHPLKTGFVPAAEIPLNRVAGSASLRYAGVEITREMIMGIATDKLLEEALLLPADEQASLVEKLLPSLNLSTEAEVNRLWAEEAERRVSRIEAGKIELIPGKEVFANIQAKYQ